MGTQTRLQRERLTVLRMVEMHCGAHHKPQHDTLCPQCRELMAYVDQRLEKCPLLARKPTCLKCPIHCYSAQRREEIRAVMRYSGPRMLFRHPILALLHLWDARTTHATGGVRTK